MAAPTVTELNPDPVDILVGVRADHPSESEQEIAEAQWTCITQTAWWRSFAGTVLPPDLFGEMATDD